MSNHALVPRARVVRATFGCWLLVGLAASPLIAQDTVRTAPAAPAKPDTGGKGAPFFHRTDMYVAAGFVGGTMLMFPLDEHIAIQLQNPNAQANKFANNTAKA